MTCACRVARVIVIMTMQMDAMQSEVEDEPAEETKDIAQVAENFKKLGANCRQLLTDFYFKKESLRTIAANFKWTEATAKNNKYRCIEKLKILLKSNKSQHE
ncbi:MAG: sigma-70 family RNA polymerase sigma factor [Sphingobacteriales bacterium]|nr:MAG: sigma-70 family RNA polymerase sigma factor [Sphingobacteriales bacterium]